MTAWAPWGHHRTTGVCDQQQVSSLLSSLEPPDSAANSGSPIEFRLGRNAVSVLVANTSSARTMTAPTVKSFQLNTGAAIPAVGLG